jgi:integrase
MTAEENPPVVITTALEDRHKVLTQKAHKLIAAGIPENTRRAYRAQWGMFTQWCEKNDLMSLPADSNTIVLYITERSEEVKISTINVALAAINAAHRESGYPNWSATDLAGVRPLLRGLRRDRKQMVKKKKAITLPDLLKILPTTEENARDRALLLVGFFGAFRRSELVNLEWSDIKSVPGGLKISIWDSKTDKNNEGQSVFIPKLDADHCPVEALKAIFKGKNGPVFISEKTRDALEDSAIRDIVRKYAARAGLDPDDYAGHSLRSGFATHAASLGAKERDIMKVTRHTSERTVRGYIQEGTFGENHPGKMMGSNPTPSPIKKVKPPEKVLPPLPPPLGATTPTEKVTKMMDTDDYTRYLLDVFAVK